MEINVIAEPWCKEQLNDLLGKHQAAAGLIIGQRRRDTYQVISFFPAEDAFTIINNSKQSDQSWDTDNFQSFAETEDDELAEDNVTHAVIDRTTDIVPPQPIGLDAHGIEECDVNFDANNSFTADGAHCVKAYESENPENEVHSLPADDELTKDDVTHAVIDINAGDIVPETTGSDVHATAKRDEESDAENSFTTDGAQCVLTYESERPGNEVHPLPAEKPKRQRNENKFKKDKKGKMYEQTKEALARYALEVVHKLPGGFFIVGIFFTNNNQSNGITTPEYLLQWQTLYYLVWSLRANNLLYGSDGKRDSELSFLLLNHDPTDTRCECTAMNGLWKSITVTFEEIPTRWIYINIRLNREFVSSVAGSKDGQFLLCCTKAAVETISNQIMEDGYRQIFINKVLIRKHETTLYKHFRPGFAYDVELHKKDVGISLHFQPQKMVLSDQLKIREWQASLMSTGKVSSHICVHPELTVANLNNYVCTEIWRNLNTRLHLSLDMNLDLSSQHKIIRIMLSQPPYRFYYKPFKGANIEFSDIKLVDNSQDQVIEKANQLFGFNLDTYSVHKGMEEEYVFSTEDILQANANFKQLEFELEEPVIPDPDEPEEQELQEWQEVQEEQELPEVLEERLGQEEPEVQLHQEGLGMVRDIREIEHGLSCTQCVTYVVTLAFIIGVGSFFTHTPHD